MVLIVVAVHKGLVVVNKNLKTGSWEHLEQIPAVRVTFVQATCVFATFVHIKNISALIRF